MRLFRIHEGTRSDLSENGLDALGSGLLEGLESPEAAEGGEGLKGHAQIGRLSDEGSAFCGGRLLGFGGGRQG